MWNLKVQQKRFADGLGVGVRESGGVKGECKVFGLSNWESLEFIPEAVGSHRKRLRLGGGDAVRCHNHLGGSQDWEHWPERPRQDGWILALAQPPPHCALLGLIKPFRTSISPCYKETVRNKNP